MPVFLASLIERSIRLAHFPIGDSRGFFGEFAEIGRQGDVAGQLLEAVAGFSNLLADIVQLVRLLGQKFRFPSCVNFEIERRALFGFQFADDLLEAFIDILLLGEDVLFLERSGIPADANERPFFIGRIIGPLRRQFGFRNIPVVGSHEPVLEDLIFFRQSGDVEFAGVTHASGAESLDLQRNLLHRPLVDAIFQFKLGNGNIIADGDFNGQLCAGPKRTRLRQYAFHFLELWRGIFDHFDDLRRENGSGFARIDDEPKLSARRSDKLMAGSAGTVDGEMGSFRGGNLVGLDVGLPFDPGHARHPAKLDVPGDLAVLERLKFSQSLHSGRGLSRARCIGGKSDRRGNLFQANWFDHSNLVPLADGLTAFNAIFEPGIDRSLLQVNDAFFGIEFHRQALLGVAGFEYQGRGSG